MGVVAGRAWEPMRGIEGLGELAALATMSERSGGALSTGCERIVDKLRNDTAHAATAAAERAGVLIALPLAVCYLPAFFILGLAPTQPLQQFHSDDRGMSTIEYALGSLAAAALAGALYLVVSGGGISEALQGIITDALSRR